LAVLDVPVIDEDAMVALGSRLGESLAAGSVVYLIGELGMGKTTLARGVLRNRGHHGAVKSPTYTLVEPYELEPVPVYHFDLYRLGDPEELEFMGIRDYFDGVSLVLVEWPERGRGVLPPADLVVTITAEDGGRRLRITAPSDRGEQCLTALVDGPGIEEPRPTGEAGVQ
jgi:tRNA threonylcarbamoyladenosine biosynthesis protein TsaE